MNYKTRQPFPHAAYVDGQRNFTHFDRSLTSGLTDVVIESPGDFLYIDQASTGVVSIELNMRQGGTLAPILLAAGGSIECDFSSIKINATAQLGKIIRVIVGNGAKIKSGATVNASSNVVTAVDGAKVRADSASAFCVYGGLAAVPGNYSHVQIFNPAASTKTVYIERITALAGAAVMCDVVSYGAALSTLAQNGVNKKLGQAVSSAQQRSQLSATPLFTDSLAVLSPTVTASDLIMPIEPFAMVPGKGFNVIPRAVNTACYIYVEWFEE